MKQSKKDFIRLVPISNGTVLDHLPVKTALKILEMLNLNYEWAVTIAINTESKKLGRKDLIFIDKKALNSAEIEKIGLIAKGATLNIIENSVVKKKEKISLPKKVTGILSCINPNCITNFEGFPTKFSIHESPLEAKCFYCEKTMDEKEIFEKIR